MRNDRTGDPDMGPDKAAWQRLDRAFSRALEEPVENREAWARARFAGQPELLTELLKLLAADAPSARLFDAAESALKSAVANARADEEQQVGGLVGQLIGPYRLQALLATGGMGAVYRAVRDDGQFSQTVAIKILPGWATDDQTVSRLRAERQILAALHHPAITHLLDGGETPDGYPYIVTEYIEGVALDQWLVDCRPDLETRLNLFIQIARAVEYAHEHGVLHRDLKPSNILVDAGNRPHLLDFGIAKLLDAGGQDWTAPRTATGFTPMTPEYSSPEQRAGTTLGAASDIYQLGLLLFEMLTGMEARRHGTRAGGATRPSTVLATSGTEARGLPDGLQAERLARQLKGDLDTIVLKALRDEPGERYPAAGDMADDIRRYLRGEPITARPETAWSAARRLARHYPVAAALSASLVVVLVVSATSLWFYAREVETQRDEALHQARRAEAGRNTLMGLFERTDPLHPETVGGRDATVWDALGAAEAEARRELADQPDILAELLATLAGLHLKAGNDSQARALLAEVIDRYRALGEGYEMDLATHLAEHAKHLASMNREAAEPMMAEALGFVPVLRASHPEGAVAILMDAGQFENDGGHYARALAHFTLAETVADENDVANPSQHVEILFSQGNALRGLGRYDDAEPLLQEALSRSERAFGVNHARVAGVLSALAALERARGNSEAAITYAERLVTQMDGQYDDGYAGLLSARNNLAIAYGHAGRYDDEQRQLRAVIDGRQAVTGPEGSLELAGSLKNLGTSYQRSGNTGAALDALARSEALYERHAPAGSPYQALPHFTRGLVYLDDGAAGAAEPEFAEALRILEPTMGEAHFQVQATRCMLAESLGGQGRTDDAKAMARAALDGMLDSGVDRHRYIERCRLTVTGLESAGE